MSREDPLVEAVRAAAGPPDEPLDIETLVAWSRGELSGAEREAVEEHLAHSPEDAELALALRAFADDSPVEEEDRRPASDPIPPPKRPIAAPVPAPLAFPPPAYRRPRPWMAWALAASLAYGIVTTGVLVRLGRPVGGGGLALANVEIQSLDPLSGAGHRGGAGEGEKVSRKAPATTLILAPPSGFELSSGELVEARIEGPDGKERFREKLDLSSEGTFTFSLPTSSYPPGLYEIEVRRAGGALVARYEFEIVS